MIAHVKARYADGVFTPSEPLDLAEGAWVELTVAPAQQRLRRGLAAILADIEEWQKSIPPEEWAGIPSDLAMNHKHYRYGRPKEEIQ